MICIIDDSGPALRRPDARGEKIAETLGFRWDGVQDWIGSGDQWVFTDLASGFTIYVAPGSTLEHVRARMAAKLEAA